MLQSAPESASRTGSTASRRGPHRVRMTLEVDNTPSSTIDAAASTKKSAGRALCAASHQPPTAINTKRAVCAKTGPSTLAAPCEEKYIDIASPMKAYIGAAVDRYCRPAIRTPGSLVNRLTQTSGKMAIKVAI